MKFSRIRFQGDYLLGGSLRAKPSRAVIADEHGHSGGCDDDITQPTEGIGNLSENKIAQNCGENDLAVIVDRNFSCGSKGIGGGYGKLSAGCSQSCQKQKNQLFCRHGMIAEEEMGQGTDAGKSGKNKYNQGAFYAVSA